MGEMIGIRQQSGTVKVYRALPQGVGRFKGAVILNHELWGLTDQIKRVADRLAGQGYYVLAPDLFSTDRIDRQPTEELQRQIFSPDPKVRYRAMPTFRALMAPTQTPQFTSLVVSRLLACFEYAYNQPLVHQKVVMVGFGLGGDYAYDLAVRERRLRGIVVFYAHAPRLVAELRHIYCPVLALYGSKETSLMKELDSLHDKMKQADREFKSVVYEGSNHAFFNDSNVFAYNQYASDDAWGRMISFINEHCGVIGND